MDISLEQLNSAVPLAGHLGIEIVSASPQEVVARVALRPEVSNFSGAMHGGVLMSLTDTAGSTCAFLNLPAGTGTTTTDSQSRFLRPITAGFATATATVLKAGRTLIVVEVEVRDDEGKLAMKSSQTQAVLTF